MVGVAGKGQHEVPGGETAEDDGQPAHSERRNSRIDCFLLSEGVSVAVAACCGNGGSGWKREGDGLPDESLPLERLDSGGTLSLPVGHRGVFQGDQADVATGGLPWAQCECSPLAGLDRTLGASFVAILGLFTFVGAQFHATVYSHSCDFVAALALGRFAGFLWDSQTTRADMRDPGTGVFAGVRIIPVGQPLVGVWPDL